MLENAERASLVRTHAVKGGDDLAPARRGLSFGVTPSRASTIKRRAVRAVAKYAKGRFATGPLQSEAVTA
jgi:hypothetical protein